MLGVVSAAEAASVRVNLRVAGAVSGTLFEGGRYGLGEVGEFVLIEAERAGLLGRIVEVRLPERERLTVDRDSGRGTDVHAVAKVELLATIDLGDLTVTAGVSSYPRLGDRTYGAPAEFVSAVPMMLERGGRREVALSLGHVKHARSAEVLVTPERLFGRHCAVIGATGGGKSYTVATVIEAALAFNSKIVLLDPTGEYRGFRDRVRHVHLGDPIEEPPTSTKCSLPPASFTEGDFLSLFEPAGKTQGPTLRAAIRSLRLVRLRPELAVAEKPGLLVKARRPKGPVLEVERAPDVSRALDDPSTSFDVGLLAKQIYEECVWDDQGRWGNYDDRTYGYCMTLLTRIHNVVASKAMECVFGREDGPVVTEVIDQFFAGEDRLLRISVEGIRFELSAREIIANALGRFILGRARSGAFRDAPAVLVLDEAHQFLGRTIGAEESVLRLDAFELIAKEGRKYGLNICLATQRPRDIPEGVLSQMGTLVVHRLTNDRDREVVERACGEIDRSASAFLPNLQPGEAAIIGVDFPVPLTVQIHLPECQPKFRGANYQGAWRKKAER